MAEAVAHARGRGCRAAPTRWARAAPRGGCCRGCCRRPGRRGPGRCRTARSRRGWRGSAPTSRARRAAGPTARSRPSGIGGPGRSVIGLRADGEAHVDAVHDRLGAGEPRSCAPGTRRARARRAARAHWPSAAMSRLPSAALTVRISRLPTWPTARAWVTWRPSTAMRDVDVHDRRRLARRRGTARWPTRPGDRSCPRARRSPAPSPQPPNRNWWPGGDAGRAPAASSASGCAWARGRARRGRPRPEPTRRPSRHRMLPHDRRPVARRRLLARRRLPRPASAPRPRSSSSCSAPSSAARSTPCPSSTPTAPARRPPRPTWRSPFGGVPVGREGARQRRRAGRPPRRRSCSRTASPTYTSHDGASGCAARRRRGARGPDHGQRVRRAQRRAPRG